MASTEGDRRGRRQYLRADLPADEHDRLVEELRADPGLLRDLLRETTREDEAASASLLWLAYRANEPEPLLAEDPMRRGTQNALSPSPSPTAELVSPTPLSPPHDEPPPKPGGGVRPAPERPARPTPPPTIFALVPGALRGSPEVTGKKIETGSTTVWLHLRLDIERTYDDYRVVIRDSDDREVTRRAPQRPSNRNGLPTVAVALPSSLFRPGDYTAVLSGVRSGRYEEVGRYSFRVIK